jgi:atlastin
VSEILDFLAKMAVSKNLVTIFSGNQAAIDFGFLREGPVNILEFRYCDGQFESILKEVEIARIFTQVAGMPIILISFSGDQGVGKSFLLSLCVRFLKYSTEHGQPLTASDRQWMDLNRRLDAFDWGYTHNRGSTKGIYIWSKPFILSEESGTEVALFLMDTQGNFDAQTESTVNSIVYGLSTLVSSIQVYNFKEKLLAYDYKHFVILSEYAANVAYVPANEEETRFQKLVFLIRDFPPRMCPNGVPPMREHVLQYFLNENDAQISGEIRQYITNIKALYSEIDGFIMPNPGEEVQGASSSKTYNLDAIGERFLTHLQMFMLWMFGTENINLKNFKRIDGQQIRSEELIAYFYHFHEKLKNLRQKEMLSIGALNEALIESSNENAIKVALAYYCNQMKSYFELLMVWSDDAVNENHARFSRATLEYFRNLPRRGNEDEKLRYERRLIVKMEEIRVEVIKVKDIKILVTTFGGLITGIGSGLYLIASLGIEVCVAGAVALFNLFRNLRI